MSQAILSVMLLAAFSCSTLPPEKDFPGSERRPAPDEENLADDDFPGFEDSEDTYYYEDRGSYRDDDYTYPDGDFAPGGLWGPRD